MRLFLLPLPAFATTGAVPAPADTMVPGYSRPAQPWTTIDEAHRDRACSDRIEQVRGAAGQPKLERLPASPERPLMIAAVDKRIDGCAVMQMKGNVNDLRPLPLPSEGPPALMPAR